MKGLISGLGTCLATSPTSPFVHYCMSHCASWCLLLRGPSPQFDPDFLQFNCLACPFGPLQVGGTNILIANQASSKCLHTEL